MAGVIDKGETPLAAAQRELAEETGFGGGEWSLFMTLSPNPNNHNNLSYTFYAKGVEKISEAHQEATEDIRVHVLSKTDVREILDKNMMLQALHVAPLYKFFVDYAI